MNISGVLSSVEYVAFYVVTSALFFLRFILESAINLVYQLFKTGSRYLSGALLIKERLRKTESSGILSASYATALRVEQTRFFLEQSLSGMMGASPLALFVAYLFSDFSPHLYLGLWIAAIYLMLAMRIFLSRRWLAEVHDPRRCEEIRRLLLILWGASGLVWATGLFLFMPADNLITQFFVLTLVALAMIGGLSVASIYFPVCLLFAYPILISQSIWFAARMDRVHLGVAGLILFLLVMLTIAAKGLQKNYLKTISLRFENSELLGNLSSFRSALEHATDAIAIFSRGGLVEYANPAFEHLSGYKREELSGKNWKDIYSNIDQALEFFRGGQSMIGKPWRGKLHLRRKDGSEVNMMSSFSPMLDRDSGRVSRCIVIQRDVEEEERVRERMERLQRAESLAVMAGGIAHDFNNLLTAIMGSASLVSISTGPDHEAHDHCERINKACQKAADLCNQMLAYSGQGRYSIKPLNMARLLQGMRGSLNASIYAKLDGQGEIVYNFDDSLPLINADAGQVRQVISNLVINASEAIDGREGGVITVKSYPVRLEKEILARMHVAEDAKAGSYVCLEVSDNGEGMERSTLERVFDPFFSTRFTGRGLGLPAVRGVVFGHGGALNIESKIGHGTVVRAYFPCADSRSDSLQATVDDYTASIIGWSGLGTVLVIDGDDTLLTVASNMIERTGFQVLCASSGAEAVKLYQQYREQISFVLLDWSIPEMDGEAVVHALRRIQPDVKILLSSGYSRELVMQHFTTRDVFDFIQKPYSFEQLKHKLRKVINA